jgi:hypothetical protein
MKFLAPQADLPVLMHRTREIINVLKINENQIGMFIYLKEKRKVN